MHMYLTRINHSQQTGALTAFLPASKAFYQAAQNAECFELLSQTSASAGPAWHDIPHDQMEPVSLQRDLWTGLIVPQQVWISASCLQSWQHYGPWSSLPAV